MNRVEELNIKIEELFVQRSSIEADLEKLVKKELLDLLQTDVAMTAVCSINFWKNAPRCVITINFINEEGNRDFGSSFDLYYENNEIAINYGTIGTYTKHYKYQVLRVKLFNAIWENVERLEKVFEDFNPQFEIYKNLDNTIYEYREEKNKIKQKEREDIYKTIEDDLKVDDCYQTISRYGNRGRIYKITKITNKLVYTEYKDRWNTWGKQFKKDEFIFQIYNKELEKIENPGLNS